MRNDKKNLIVTLTFELAIEIISFSEKIRSTTKWPLKFSEAELL